MRTVRILGIAGLIVVLAVAMPGTVTGQNKDKQPTGNPASPEDYAQLGQLREVIGQLGSGDGGAKTLILRLESQHVEPNPNFKPGTYNFKNPQGKNGQYQQWQQMQKLKQQQAEAMRSKDPRRLQQVALQMQKMQMQLQMQMAKEMIQQQQKGFKPGNNQNQNGPFKIVTTSKEFELDMADKVVIRRLNPPFEYDDRGNIKQFTKEELLKLRGTDASKPGYAAKLEDLAMGQKVRLTLEGAKKDNQAKNILDRDEGVGNVARPTVAMVLILEEGAGQPVVEPKGKKKAK